MEQGEGVGGAVNLKQDGTGETRSAAKGKATGWKKRARMPGPGIFLINWEPWVMRESRNAPRGMMDQHPSGGRETRSDQEACWK